MTDRDEWQGRVGDKWAQEWARTDRSFSALTDRLLAMASFGGFSRALDIGCGAGEVSLALARGHAGARVHGIDVNRALIEVARSRGSQHANLSFEVADASGWAGSGDGSSPDLLVSRHGVMFFPDPVAAFASLRQTSDSDARLVFSCFRDRAQNDWANEIAGLLPQATGHDPHAPGPFAFADRDRVSSILTRAGWHDIAFERFDYPYIAGSGDRPVEDATSFFLAIGPAAAAAAELDSDARSQFKERLRALMEKHRDGGLVMMRAAAWMVTARALA